MRRVINMTLPSDSFRYQSLGSVAAESIEGLVSQPVRAAVPASSDASTTLTPSARSDTRTAPDCGPVNAVRIRSVCSVCGTRRGRRVVRRARRPGGAAPIEPDSAGGEPVAFLGSVDQRLDELIGQLGVGDRDGCDPMQILVHEI
ncbi:hypothetical protein [Pseudonocardia yunnanensis]|uniref:Uncharacterized protein n=1 Tax=Pseudonocardia yunnanensis TaxID=58107 RepID=A0ABW4ETS0_9PSEU